MSLLSRLRSFAHRIIHRREMDKDLDDEIRSQLELIVDQKIKQGMRPEEARRAAKIELGGVEQLKEQVRVARTGVWLDSLLQDIRFAVRMLRKNPVFTMVAVLTLALGIGVNTSIFSIFNTFLFQHSPVDRPDRLTFIVFQGKHGGEGNGFSYQDFVHIQTETQPVFSDVSAVSPPLQADGLNVNGTNQLIHTCYVSGSFFGMLGIQPALGRFILPSEGKTPSADPVIVLSYDFWKSQFNRDPKVIGSTVAVNGRPVTIIGVAPEGFHGADLSIIDTQAYLPLSMQISSDGTLPGGLLIARLKNGVTLSQANSRLDLVAHQLSIENQSDETWKTLRARSLGPLGPITGPNPLPIVAALFLTLAGFVLLLACVNLANLFLARATIRRRETAVRAALGATRRRLTRQFLTETIVLSLFGAALGMLLGIFAIKAMSSFPLGISGSSSPIFVDFRFDWRVFMYALVAALVSGMMVGLVPALRSSGVDLNYFLHDGDRSTGQKRVHSRSVLVIAQVAGSLMLLVVAGLFARSLNKVQRMDLGFDSSHVLNLSMNPNQAGYHAVQGRQLLNDLLQRVRTLPGVESASLAATVPLGGTNFGAPLEVKGYQPPRGSRYAMTGENMVSSEYFTTMGIPLLKGRAILDSDDATSQRVAVINQAMADEYWPHQDPIGRRFTNHDPGFPLPVAYEVVGIVRNSRATTLATSLPVLPYFYVPLAQDFRLPATLQVRTAAPLAMAHEILDVIRTLAPLLPVFDVQTMTQALDSVNGLVLFKVGATLAASLGALGLLLAVVGVYGVVSYSAAQRTREIGVRMALGAQQKRILTMILRQGCITVGLGLGAGIVGSMAMAALVRKFLLGVSALDPLTYLVMSAFLALIALIACYIPARRATRVDPMIALRHE